MDLCIQWWRRAGRVAFAALMALALAAPAHAGPNSGKLSLTAGTDFTTAYFFRGILQERYGFIAQPYGELNLNVYSDDEGPLTSFTLIGGLWTSVHTEKTLQTGSGPSNWYEADAYTGFKFSLLKKLETKLLYIAYTYPNGAFNTVQELDAIFSLNDSDWFGGKFGFYPSFTVAGEIDNTAIGTDRGVYYEVAVRPSFTAIQSDTYPVSVAFPMTLGLGTDYFEDVNSVDDDAYGYFRGGVILSMPLAFIPADYGSWSVNGGAYLYTFGDNLQEANLDDDPWVVGTWGISMTY